MPLVSFYRRMLIMKRLAKHISGILIAISMAVLFSCGNSNPDQIPTYTATNSTDSSQVSGGIVQTQRGKELFQLHCIACHGLAGNHKNENAADLQVSIIDSLTIVNAIRNGKTPMPLFGPIFADLDLAQLELYVKTLRKH